MKSPFQIWEPPISPAPPTKRTRIGGAGSPLHGPRHILDSRRTIAGLHCFVILSEAKLQHIAVKRSLQTWPPYRLFESKFNRDSDFETPVAVFVLEFELYVVTTGLPFVGGIEQPESINNALVDAVFGHLTAAITEIEASLCGRGHPRG